jgi:cation transport regulator
MPYRSIDQLPAKQVRQYSTHQKTAFLEAFNSALQQYGNESDAFAVAHAAAKKAARKTKIALRKKKTRR